MAKTMDSSKIEYKIVKSLPVDVVVDLYREGGWWKENYSSEKIPLMIKGSFCFVVANDNGVPIGMGRVISDGFSDGYIQDVVVRKTYRKRGIGLEIIRKLTAYCVQQGLGWIGLVAEPNTTSFYEKSGYVKVDDHTLMILKDLSLYE